MLYAPGDVRVEDRPDPAIEQPTDSRPEESVQMIALGDGCVTVRGRKSTSAGRSSQVLSIPGSFLADRD